MGLEVRLEEAERIRGPKLWGPTGLLLLAIHLARALLIASNLPCSIGLTFPSVLTDVDMAWNFHFYRLISIYSRQ